MDKVIEMSNGGSSYFEQWVPGTDRAAAKKWQVVAVWTATEQTDSNGDRLYSLDADPSQTRVIPARLIEPSTYAAAASLGRKGGSVSSPAKAEAARRNAKLGGRPPKKRE